MEGKVVFLSIALLVLVQYARSADYQTYKCGKIEGNTMNISIHGAENLEHDSLKAAIANPSNGSTLLNCSSGFEKIDKEWELYKRGELMIKIEDLKQVGIAVHLNLKNRYCFEEDAGNLHVTSCKNDANLIRKGFDDFIQTIEGHINNWIDIVAKFVGGSKIAAWVILGFAALLILILLVWAIIGISMCCCKCKRDGQVSGDEAT